MDLPSPIKVSPERSMEETSEGQQDLDHYENYYKLMFGQR